jgi:ATP-dependent phosphoenolpyruvate carboxykinase
VPGVLTEILNPVNTWKDKDEFDKTAALVGMFQKNLPRSKPRSMPTSAPRSRTCGLRRSDARRCFRNEKK